MARTLHFRGSERFQVLRRLGEGGMGEVYEAYDRQKESIVALKTISNFSASSLMRFKNEFRALHEVSHPNLVRLGELLEEEGEWFFTMELIPGIDMLRFIRGESYQPPNPGERSTGSPNEAFVNTATPSQAEWDDLSMKRVKVRQHDGGFDENRLRLAMGQLALGVQALHDAGKLHRDIKPSNVLVDTERERVVLLDFGLVTDEERQHSLTAGGAVGTAAYMSPEQAISKGLTPASDWYSVGIVLYEALTGRLPFTGTNLEIMIEKQNRIPPPPTAYAEAIPEDLNELCVGLLNFDPEKRPSPARVLRSFAVDSIAPTVRTTSQRSGDEIPFIGRQAELTRLKTSFADSRSQGPVLLIIDGPSGMGKSELIKHFSLQTRRDFPDALVFSSRCYERESAHYKAFDGVADSISRFLSKLEENARTALLPMRAGLLAKLFPVLGRIPEIANAPLGRNYDVDPQELRRQMFSAFRELLVRIGQRYPVVLRVEDLQWADPDSLELLKDVMHPPDAPQLLMLTTVRTDALSALDIDHLLHESVDIRQMTLERLTDDDAHHILSRIAPDMSLKYRLRILSEVDGHPLFLMEMVRYVDEHGIDEQLFGLDEVLRKRIHELSEGAVVLVECLSVAGAPVPVDVAHLATGLTKREFEQALSNSRLRFLTKTSARSGDEIIGLFHTRIGDAVLNEMSGAQRVDYHRRLAKAYQQSGAGEREPQALLQHLTAAGEKAHAAERAEQAAELAFKALAFDRAAKLLRAALALGDYSTEKRREMQMKLADSLLHAGRGKESADLYIEASQGSNHADRLRFEGQAAKQYLLSGNMSKGLQTLRNVMENLGEKVPESRWLLRLLIVWLNLKLWLRGLRWQEVEESEVDQHTLNRLDVYAFLAQSLGMTDPLRAALFMARGLLYALRVGEPFRLARALALQAGGVAAQGRPKRANRLLQEASRISHEMNDAFLRGLVHMSSGVVRALSSNDRRSEEHYKAAEESLLQAKHEASWELSSTRWTRLLSMRSSGQLQEITRLYRENMRDAQRRGDRYLESSLVRSSGALVACANDEIFEYRRALNESNWQSPPNELHVQDFHELVSSAEAALYQGEAHEFLKTHETEIRAMFKSNLCGIRRFENVARWTIARLYLARATAEFDVEHSLKMVWRYAKDLESKATALEKVFVHILRGSVHWLSGKKTETKTELRRAMMICDESQLLLYLNLIKRSLGTVIGQNRGKELTKEAETWMTSEGIRQPNRFSAMFVPAFVPVSKDQDRAPTFTD